MSKLIIGILLVLLSIEETVRAFSHHFLFTYETINMDEYGKQYLISIIFIIAGLFCVYKAGEQSGKKNVIGFEDFFDDGC